MFSPYVAILDGVSLAEVLALAAAVALSPVPIAAAIAILGSRRARPNGVAFVAGWTVGIAFVGTVVLLLADGEPGGESSDLAEVLKLVLGLVLVGIAIQSWRGRPLPGERPQEPRWLRTLDALSARRAFGLGLLLAAVYPKTLLLVATAGATMAETTSGAAAQTIVLAAFVLIGAGGVATPVVIQLRLGARSEPALRRLRGWLTRHGVVALAALFIVVGVALIVDALPDLLG